MVAAQVPLTVQPFQEGNSKGSAVQQHGAWLIRRRVIPAYSQVL